MEPFTEMPANIVSVQGVAVTSINDFKADVSGLSTFDSTTDLVNANVFVMEPPLKINFMGPAYCYMEINGMNCIDETSPYSVSEFTLKTNQTNGVVNSAFAKIAVPTTPISQWFDRDSIPYKFYYPPAERMRKLKFKFRYHNGAAAEFGVFPFSFVIEFTLQLPQILRNSKTVAYPMPK
jgi:hypothetical protein